MSSLGKAEQAPSVQKYKHRIRVIKMDKVCVVG